MDNAVDNEPAAGVLDRIAVLHLVLDKDLRHNPDEPRIEWQQVAELAAEQAARVGSDCPARTAGRCGMPAGPAGR